MPAGVWSKSLNTVYHNETLRGGRWRSPSLRSDAPLGFLTPPNLNTTVHVRTSGGRHTISPGGDYKVAMGVFTQLGRTPGDKGPMPTFAGATQQKQQQEIFILGAKLSEDGKTYCWPFSVGHCVCLELTTSERESLLSLAGGRKKKMELKTSL